MNTTEKKMAIEQYRLMRNTVRNTIAEKIEKEHGDKVKSIDDKIKVLRDKQNELNQESARIGNEIYKLSNERYRKAGPTPYTAVGTKGLPEVLLKYDMETEQHVMDFIQGKTDKL